MNKKPGHILREIRLSRGLSQEALGALVGSDRKAISRLETCTHELTIDWAKRLAVALGILPYKLLGDIGVEDAEEKVILVLNGLNDEAQETLRQHYLFLLSQQKNKS